MGFLRQDRNGISQPKRCLSHLHLDKRKNSPGIIGEALGGLIAFPGRCREAFQNRILTVGED